MSMIYNRISLFMATIIIIGFFFLALPEKGFAGIPMPPNGNTSCCQWDLEGQLGCSDLPQGFLCAIPDGADFINTFRDSTCNEQTGQCMSTPRDVPTLSVWGLIAMAGVLGVVGFMVMRRKKLTA